MFHIQDTIVSLEIIEKTFCCDLSVCKGRCCIEGDAGAPVTEEEERQIKLLLPSLLPLMRKEARDVVEQRGISYDDPTGERVLEIVDGRDCIFSRTNRQGWCYCLIEKLCSEGKSPLRKPASCALYPVRLAQYPSFTAVEYHHWDICHCARQLGKKKHLPVYQFLREPLIARFGKEWYDELCLVAEEWQKQKK